MNYYREKRLLLIEQLGGKCVKCGTIHDLEFDHIDPTKKEYSIAKIWSNDEKLKTELPKCQLLCKQCHLEKTVEYSKNLPKKEISHGTLSKYMRYKCRCDLCKKAFSIWKKERYRKNAKNNVKQKKEYNRIVEHGDPLCYTRGCRCDLCKKANAERAKETRRNKKGTVDQLAESTDLKSVK